jgi:hypothetical protein
MIEHLSARDYISFADAFLQKYDQATELQKLGMLRSLQAELQSTIGASLVLAVLEAREGKDPSKILPQIRLEYLEFIQSKIRPQG